MKSRLFIIMGLIAAVTFTSCRPKGILHSWEMREIMVDLHKTDAMLQISGLTQGYDEAKNIYYAQVLEKHGTTQAQFDSSLVWYTAHPQLFDKIYPKVLTQLKAEEEAFIAQNEDALNALASETIAVETPKEESMQRPFTRMDLDSVLWVTQHGYCTDWNKWERKQPFVFIDR